MNRFQMVDRIEELESQVEALRASSAASDTALERALERWDSTTERHHSTLDNLHRLMHDVSQVICDLEEAGAHNLPLYKKLKDAVERTPTLSPKVREHAEINRELRRCIDTLSRHDPDTPLETALVLLEERAKHHHQVRHTLVAAQRMYTRQRKRNQRA